VRTVLPRLRGRRHLPIQVRLTAGFAVAMMVLLTAAGAFVYSRVRYALDLRLNEDLTARAAEISEILTADPQRLGDVLNTVGPTDPYDQLLDSGGKLLVAGPASTGAPLLAGGDLRRARTTPLLLDRGAMLPISRRPLRIYAFALPPDAARSGAVIGVVTVRLDQRDEALRELLAQLTLANLGSLVIACGVGYRLAAASLSPVERYRRQAEEIAAGASGVRLDVPAGRDDDVTRLGRTLNAMLRSLEASTQQQRRFIQDASHELRTPLTLMTSEIDIALRRPRSVAELRSALLALKNDTAALTALTNQLLTLGVTSDPGHLQLAEVPLDALIEETAERARRLLDSDPHRRVLTAAGFEHILISVDHRWMSQALGNLVDNAITHGSGHITIAGRLDHAVAIITIADEGLIRPDFLPHATERFRRADEARTTLGSGLGLALAQTIVEAHAGELRICSDAQHHREHPRFDIACLHPQSGTTVSVLLSTDRNRAVAV
jgi:two-component system OmpR family sensor kinase